MVSNREAGRLGYEKSREHMQRTRERQHAEAVVKYESEAKCCKQCLGRISYEGRRNDFCSRLCSALHSNLARGRSLRVCKSCNGPLLKRGGSRIYCDGCHTVRWSSMRVSSLEEARSDLVRKRILIEDRGRHCEVCAKDTWMSQPIPIELDHIDGNSDNNIRENLRLLCPNCHAQTSTYKAKNKGRAGLRGAHRRKVVVNV